MPRKSPISIFLAATSILTIAATEDVSLKAGENDLGGLKEWSTDTVSYTHLTLPTICSV